MEFCESCLFLANVAMASQTRLCPDWNLHFCVIVNVLRPKAPCPVCCSKTYTDDRLWGKSG